MSKYSELKATLAAVEADLNHMKNDRDFWKQRANDNAAEITRLDIKLAHKQPETQKQSYLEKAAMALSAGDQTSGDIIELAKRIEKYEVERKAKAIKKFAKAERDSEDRRAKAKAEFGLTEIGASERSYHKMMLSSLYGRYPYTIV